MTHTLHTCRFGINTWQHLYALHFAVRQRENNAANQLVITGVIRNHPLFEHRDTPIQLSFVQTASPTYPHIGEHLSLASLPRQPTLNASIALEPAIFAELKKNLAEYNGIEGVQIVVTLGLLLPNSSWPENATADIVQLEYAMKGDGG